MTQHKWWASEPPPDNLRVLMAQDAGKGLGNFTDRAYWLDIHPDCEPWLNALAAVDERGDVAPLLGLLASARMPQEMQTYLADMLGRYTLKRKRGQQRTPAYDRSVADTMLDTAKIAISDRVRDGASYKTALEQVSVAQGIPQAVIDLHYQGRRGPPTTRKKRSKA